MTQCPQTVGKQEVPSEVCKLARSVECAELSIAFGPALHYPDNGNFTIWDAKQQEVRPACRVEPSTAPEVSHIIDTLVRHWCHFAVKGGGHSRNPGDSNSIGGVTVNLDLMTHVDIPEHENMAPIEGGADSYQVYDALDAHNLSFVGGRVGTVGVGGFTGCIALEQPNRILGYAENCALNHDNSGSCKF